MEFTEPLDIEDKVNEIDLLAETIEELKRDIAELSEQKKTAENYLAECKFNLGDELKIQKFDDGVMAHRLSDGRTVSPHRLPIKLVIENEKLLPEEYVTIVNVTVEKREINKDKLEADLLANKSVPGAHLVTGKYTITFRR